MNSAVANPNAPVLATATLVAPAHLIAKFEAAVASVGEHGELAVSTLLLITFFDLHGSTFHEHALSSVRNELARFKGVESPATTQLLARIDSLLSLSNQGAPR